MKYEIVNNHIAISLKAQLMSVAIWHEVTTEHTGILYDMAGSAMFDIQFHVTKQANEVGHEVTVTWEATEDGFILGYISLLGYEQEDPTEPVYVIRPASSDER